MRRLSYLSDTTLTPRLSAAPHRLSQEIALEEPIMNALYTRGCTYSFTGLDGRCQKGTVENYAKGLCLHGSATWASSPGSHTHYY